MKIDLAETTASTDRRFDAMADDRRRHVLSALCRTDTALSLSELAISLANAETGPAEPGGETDPVHSRKIELYHWHVPKLEAAGLVEFDADRKTVVLATEFEDADDPAEILAT